MIEIGKFRHLGEKEIKKYAGIYWFKDKCIGAPECKREGDHDNHWWWVEVMIVDDFKTFTKKGEDDKEISMPMRWYNFCWCVWRIMETRKIKTIDDNIISSALKMAKNECFGLDNMPENIAQKNGVSYGKLVKEMEQDIQTYNYGKPNGSGDIYNKIDGLVTQWT